MKQPQYQPLSVSEMALTLFAANEGYFDDVEVNNALNAEKAMRDFARAEYGPLVDKIENEKKFDDDIEKQMHEMMKAFKEKGSY